MEWLVFGGVEGRVGGGATQYEAREVWMHGIRRIPTSLRGTAHTSTLNARPEVPLSDRCLRAPKPSRFSGLGSQGALSAVTPTEGTR